MTTSPLRKNQAGQPSKNGGEFAATRRADAPEGLLTTATGPMADFEAAAGKVRTAHDSLVDTASRVIRELINRGAPEAVTATFTHGWDDEGHGKLKFISAYNADGDQIDLPADVEGDVSYIGDVFEDIADVDRQSDFVYAKTKNEYTLDLTVEPATDGDVAAHELDGIRQSQADDEAALAPTARRALTGYATKEFPDAASVILTNINGGPGSPYLVAQSILAADGTELWVRDWDDEFTDVTETLDGHAVALDRDMGSLEVVTKGWEREATWRVTV